MDSCEAGGGANPLLIASACRDNIRRFAAWRSASRSSAVWRLQRMKKINESGGKLEFIHSYLCVARLFIERKCIISIIIREEIKRTPRFNLASFSNIST